MTAPPTRREVRAVLLEALDLLQDHEAPAPRTEEPVPSLPGLLDRCQALAGEGELQRPPIRMVHHLACTGGTLLCRCIAAMPNVRLLSEVEPLSPLTHRNAFLPADLIGLAKFGSRPPEQETLLEIFRAGLRALHDTSWTEGLDLVLRVHSHSQFMHGQAVPDRPGLRAIVGGDLSETSIVTVRHPLDSYLALAGNGWLHFRPQTLEEYARRYHAFLDHHEDLEWISYEEFVADPETVMQRICACLDLRYEPGFRETFPAITLSGDSGRSGGVIAPRPRKELPREIAEEARESTAYTRLCERLGYTP